MIKKHNVSLNQLIGSLSVILLLVLFTLNIVNIRSDIVLQIVIYCILASIALFSVLLRKTMSLYSLSIIGFSIYIILITLFNQNMNLSVFGINFGYMTLWIWVILLFNYANEKSDFNESLFTLISIFSIIIGIYIILNYDVRNMEGDWGFVNTNYYLLCALPIILLTKKGLIKNIAIIVACLTVLLSAKRTGILALLAIGVFLLIYNLKNSTHFKLKALAAILLFVILSVSYDKITELLGVDFFSRFDSLAEDGGSGRNEIYKQWFDSITNAGFFKILFGSGYNSFINVFGSEYSSHNDIMEILIDYGLFGLIFYMCVILRYIKICLYNIKHNSPYASACIAAICAFTFISLFGHCVIYPSYFMYILIFWTYIERKTLDSNNLNLN